MRIILNQSIAQIPCAPHARACVCAECVFPCAYAISMRAIYWSSQSGYSILQHFLLLWVNLFCALIGSILSRRAFNQDRDFIERRRYRSRRSNVYWKFNNNYLIVMNWQE